VYLNSLPSGVTDYEAFDLSLTYAGVTSQNNADTLAWPGCTFLASHYQPGKVLWGCSEASAASPSTYIGLIGTNTFNCTPGASSGNTITLVHGVASGDTRLIERLGSIHAQGELTTEHLTVNCVNPGALVVDAIGDSTSPGDPVNAVRNVSVGTPFYVTTHVTAPPVAGTTGYRAYQTELRWDEPLLEYLPAVSAADEDFWQENAPTSCTVAPRIIKPDDDVGTDAAVSNACVAAASNTYTGPVVQLRFVCQPPGGTAQLSLVSSVGDPTYGTRFVAANGAQTLPVLANATINCVATDSDGDGMPDWWEALHPCTNAGVPDAGDDDDLDGATHLQEFTGGSDPCDADSDGDGLSDGAELLTYFTDPNSADSDGDGLSDFDEINTFFTDPNSADGDSDGLNDGFELSLGTDPNDSDSDSDTHSDGQEHTLGSNPLSAASTPEHAALPSTCTDFLDNDGDLATDNTDTACAGFPPSGVSADGGHGAAADGTPLAVRGQPVTIAYKPLSPATSVTIQISDSNPPAIGPVSMVNVNGNGTRWEYTFSIPGAWKNTPVVHIVADAIPLGDFGIRLIDPSGTVFDSATLAPIQGATVRLFRINPVTLDPQAMDPILHAGMFNPELNPEATGSDGRYAWDVAAGDYFVRVSKPGCSMVDSSVVTIPPPVTTLNVGLVCPDTDGDGLKDYEEIELGTSYIDRDHDNDGCTEGQELGPNKLTGGQRDPLNPYDYFNPTHDGKVRVDDILLVVQAYFKDDTDGNPGLPPYTAGYNPDTDRLLPMGAPHNWSLQGPNGQQRVDDIVNIVKQYFHDCS
jgi:hypothetical protein